MRAWREWLSVVGDLTYGTMLGPVGGNGISYKFCVYVRDDSMIPFHTERASSALVAFMAGYTLGALTL